MTVKELIEEIKGFLQGKDHSLTPQLRRLHDAYVGYSEELRGQVEELRRISESMSLADASAKARQMDPPLAQRVEMLDFPGREEFLEICRMYDLPPIPVVDTDFVRRLSGPVNTTENKTAALMQEWRRVARTGTTSQRMNILRKIVAQRPADDAWSRNLVEIEKKRYLEIKAILEGSSPENPLDFQTLDNFNQELHSPLLLSKPPMEIVRKVLELFLPLQEEKVAGRLEECLKALEVAFGDHDNAAVENELQKWNELASNPLAHPQREQLQFVEDVRSALESERQEAARKAQFDDYLSQFREAVANPKKTYAETLAIYNELVLLDLPLPQSVQEDMDRLTEEHDNTERRLHARRIVFGFMTMVVVVVLLVASLVIIQRRNRVRKCCQEIQASIDAKDFEGAIQFVDGLASEDPRTVASPDVQALYAEAQAGQAMVEERRRLATKEFQELKARLSEVILEDYLGTGEMEKLLSRLEELKADLGEEDQKELIALVTAERAKYNRLVQIHEKKFRADWAVLCQDMDHLQTNLTAMDDMRQIDAAVQAVQKKMDALRAETKVDAGLRTVTEEQYKKRFETLSYVVGVERVTRETLEHLHHPSSFKEYLQALKAVSETKGEPRYRPYLKLADTSHWCQLRADLAAIVAYFTQLRPLGDLSTKLGTNFKNFMPVVDDCDAVEQFLKTIKANFNYYEIIARDDKGQAYFFYPLVNPALERDRRNRNYYRYVGFDTDVYSNKGQDSFVFSLERSGRGVIYRDVEYDNEKMRAVRKLPKSFVSLEGWMKPVKADAFRLADEAQTQIASGISRAHVTKELLQNSKSIRNPLARYWFTLETLKLLQKIAPMAKDMLEQFIQNYKRSEIKVSNWKFPDGCIREQSHLAGLQGGTDELNLERLILTSDIFWQFVGAFYSRPLVPVGVIGKESKTKMSFWFFDKHVPVEAYVFSGDELHLIDGEILRGKKDARLNPNFVFEGQLLWAFEDGRKTEDFLLEWRAKCQKQDIRIEWIPDICPMELRYLMK